MPWEETCTMDQRVRFIAEYLKDELSVAELCRRFGISRKTGHKWINRYHDNGPEGLWDRSHRPHHHPWTTPEAAVQSIIAAKQAYPSLGPKKLKALLEAYNPGVEVPAASTIGAILKRNGWVTPRKRRRHAAPRTTPFGQCDRPNALWCVDFKGHFQTGRLRCYPLTLIDAHSRYLLRCQALKRPRGREVRAAFESAFAQFGLPEAIRSDNGPPFASTGPGGLTRLSVWWVKLGIRIERIEPGKPQQNGRQERFHLTLKQQTASPPQATFRAQQRAFDRFRAFYNDLRPHEALAQTPPAQHYHPADRPGPERAPDPDYPHDVETFVVSPVGSIDWRGRQVHVGKALARELVGLECSNDDTWTVCFGPIKLGSFSRRLRRDTPVRLTPPPTPGGGRSA